MKQAVDLSQTMEGHALLWAKGRYPGRTASDVFRVYAGFTGDYAFKHVVEAMMNALIMTGQFGPNLARHLVDSYMMDAMVDTGSDSSYHVTGDDKVQVSVLLDSLVNVARNGVKVIDKGQPVLILPEPFTEEQFKEIEKWREKSEQA